MENQDIILNVVYEINAKGNCMNCKARHRLIRCNAFDENFSSVKKVSGEFVPEQVDKCRCYLSLNFKN